MIEFPCEAIRSWPLSMLGIVKLQQQFHYLWSVFRLFLLDSVLEGCIFPETCPFLLLCKNCWYNFSSIFFFCIFVISVAISLSFLILFISSHSLFFLMSLAKCLLTSFIFSNNQLSKNQVSFIFSSVFCLFYLYPFRSLLFSSFFWLFVSSILPVLIHLDGRLGCLFKIFLVSWGRPVSL